VKTCKDNRQAAANPLSTKRDFNYGKGAKENIRKEEELIFEVLLRHNNQNAAAMR